MTGFDEPILIDFPSQLVAARKGQRLERLLERRIVRLCVFGSEMDKAGRAWGGLRTEERPQLLQVNRLGDVKDVQYAEIAARDHFCGNAAPEFRFNRRCEGHPTLR